MGRPGKNRRAHKAPNLKREVRVHISRVAIGLLSFLAGLFFLANGLVIYFTSTYPGTVERDPILVGSALRFVSLGVALIGVTLAAVFLPVREKSPWP